MIFDASATDFMCLDVPEIREAAHGEAVPTFRIKSSASENLATFDMQAFVESAGGPFQFRPGRTLTLLQCSSMGSRLLRDEFEQLSTALIDVVWGYAIQMSGANLGEDTISSDGRIAVNCTAALGSVFDMKRTNAGGASKVGPHMLRAPA